MLRCTNASCLARCALLLMIICCISIFYLPTPHSLTFCKNPIRYESQLRELLAKADDQSSQLIQGFNREQIFNNLQLDLGPTVRYSDYVAMIEGAANDVFPFAQKHPKTDSLVQNAKAAAALHAWPLSVNNAGSSHEKMPERLCTTARNMSDMPSQWATWPVLNPHLDIFVYNDTTMEEWLDANVNLPGQNGELSFREEYERLPRMIMKSDLFRYLQVFFEGGIYADSDTAPIHAITEWGNKGSTQDWTDKQMLALTTEAQMLGRGDPSELVPINEAPPLLIFSIEHWIDQWWDTTMCGMQAVQWAFGGYPGHPIFLDLFNHVIAISKEVDTLENKDVWMTDEAVFQWTGPCIFAGAVWRYLWARWGFDFRRLNGVEHPVRVGDVLIMPYGAFQATYSELHVEQPWETMMWHGANGFRENGWRTREAEQKAAEKDDQSEDNADGEVDGDESEESPPDGVDQASAELTARQWAYFQRVEKSRQRRLEKVSKTPIKMGSGSKVESAETSEELRA